MRKKVLFIILLILGVFLFFLAVGVGSVFVSPREILDIIMGNGTNPSHTAIIMQIRLPRVIAAILLGGALSVSGFLLQTYFHNPIAGPFILGISSGAKLMVALLMIALLGQGYVMHSSELMLAAFCGSMLAMGFVLMMAKKVSNMSVLVVCGVMVSYICSAITDFVVTFADDSNIVNLHNWSLGSFAGMDWGHVKMISFVVILTFLVTFFLSKPIGAYQLGEDYARSMGVNVRGFGILLILLSSILSACVTAFAGPISFVGVAVPHLMKQSFRTAKPIVMIPACFLGGSIFCLLCDLLARTMFAPTELSISSVTAVFGAPIVIYMMMHKKRG